MDTVNINVSGKKFIILKHVLKRYPDTRLGKLSENCAEYDRKKQRYYFDRNPKLMVSVLDLYRTGELHLPENVCSFSVKNELDYWDIDTDLIAECCWKKYAASVRYKAVVDMIEKSFNECPEVTPKDAKFREILWMTMQFPQYSIFSKIWFAIYMMFVVAVVVITCLYTIPSLREPLSRDDSHFNSTSIMEMLLKSEMKSFLFQLDIACLAFFTLEFIVKFIVCPKRCIFLKDPLNVLDLFLAVVMWLSVIIDHIEVVEHAPFAHMVLRSMFCLNVLRIFQLSKTSVIMKLVTFTIRASLRAFGLLMVTMTMAVIIFATLIYFAEVATKADTFANIPLSIWWTIVTMTTVGYGDYYPHSWAGYIVGSLCSLSGILLIALPIAIIASNFDTFYSNMPAAEQRRKLKRRRERRKRAAFVSTGVENPAVAASE